MSQISLALPLTHPSVSIVATAGPAVVTFSDSGDNGANTEVTVVRSQLGGLIKHGASILRINMSHNPPEDFAQVHALIAHIRELEAELEIPVLIMMDLKGPEIRVGLMHDQNGTEPPSLALERDDLVFVTQAEEPLGKKHGVPTIQLDFEGRLLPHFGDSTKLVFGDNEIYGFVTSTMENGALVKIRNAGELKPRRGVNLPDALGLTADELPVSDDTSALQEGFDVDVVAQSFVESPLDIAMLRGAMAATAHPPKKIIAKIENERGCEAIEEILEHPDVLGIMVARGDLGVLVDYRQIPEYQRKLLETANQFGKPVIVATQILESMIEKPRPHRPEVQDIATAISGGADTLMLSGETAKGLYPERCVEIMHEVSERNPLDRTRYLERFDGRFNLPDPARDVASRAIDFLGFAICDVAATADSDYIVTYATTGKSARVISRMRPDMPIIAITNNKLVARELNLSHNVYPVEVRKKRLPREPKKFVKFVREILTDLDLPIFDTAGTQPFIVATEDISALTDPDQRRRARGIFVFQA